MKKRGDHSINRPGPGPIQSKVWKRFSYVNHTKNTLQKKVWGEIIWRKKKLSGKSTFV